MAYADLTKYKEKKRRRALKRKRQNKPKTIVDAINRILENEKQHVVFRKVEEVDKWGLPTGRIIDVRVSMVNTDALAVQFLNEAANNNDMLKTLVEHNSGRAVSRHQISTDGEGGAGFIVELK